MLITSNHKTLSIQNQKRQQFDRYQRHCPLLIESKRKSTDVIHQSCDDLDSNRAESRMIIRMTLALILFGVTPLILFLLTLFLAPDLLHIEITP